MALSKRTVVLDIKVEVDGQVIVFEQDEYWEGGFTSGTMEATGPRTGRRLDVGDDVTAEDQLVKDVINGNVHSAARRTARDTVKADEGIL